MSTNTCSHITAHARCSYTTVKCVKIRNWKLGAIHYFFQFSIFCYVVVYAVIFERGFMFKEQIVGGSLTLNSQAPPRTSGLTNVSYCCNTTIGDCVNNSKVILPCAFWDEYQAEYPQSQGEMIAITTRVTVSQQSTPDNEDCTYQNWGPNCVWEDVGDPVAQFIDGAEDFTIRIRHGVRGQQVNKQGVNTGPNALSGKLVKPDKPTEAIMSWPDNSSPYPGQGEDDRKGDIIPLSVFLDAVNLDLDSRGEDGTAESSPRYDGITLIVSVYYEMQGIDGSTLTYTYIPRMLDNLEYKVEESQQITGPNDREILNRHAVRLIFVQSGVLGTFDFTALLITLVTALGLLAVANTLTNLIMTKFLDQKDLYNWHTTEVTEDVDKVLQLPPEELDAKMKVIRGHLAQGKGTFFAIDSSHLQDDSASVTSTEKSPLIGNGRSSNYESGSTA